MSSDEQLKTLVEYLQEQLGSEATAYILGFNDTKDLEHVPSQSGTIVELRLRHAYDAVRAVSQAYDGRTAKVWLVGDNVGLGSSPGRIIRHAKSVEDLSYVVSVAKEFAHC